MPFISQDWRSPGEKWIKSIEHNNAWENIRSWREKVFANLNATALKRIYRQSLTYENSVSCDELLESIFTYQPHIYIKMNPTREQPIVSTITEALIKLDMVSAIKDIRRFNYVCKLVQTLIESELQNLSGRSQIYIIEILNVIMKQVLGSCNQTFAFRKLLNVLKASLNKNEYAHVGSSQLWINHRNSLMMMERRLDNFDINKDSISSFNGKKNLTNTKNLNQPQMSLSSTDSSDTLSTKMYSSLEHLPSECLSQILLNITSPIDLQSASVASPVLALVVNDEILWKRIVVQNYTQNQIMAVQFGRSSWRQDIPVSNTDCNWKRAYIRLLSRYGEQQIHSACLGFCEKCSCLFWVLLGHPCVKPDESPRFRILSPIDFIALFRA